MRIRDILSSGALGLIFLVLSACGGGGGGGYSMPSGSAPSGLSYPSPQGLTIGQAAANISPTVTGSVTSYAVSPAVPSGLTFNSTTGVISGTPVAITAQANYTVTASNSYGSTTAVSAITVNDVKPAVNYPSGTVALATGLTIKRIAPTATGGAVTSWSVNPALPAGLNFNTGDGSITGTPTADSAAAVYTVTAANSGGSATFALTISVQAGTLLELGHADQIGTIRTDGVHVVSEDSRGHWSLWNYATAALLASGDSGCTGVPGDPGDPCPHGLPADIAGPTLIVQTPTGFELRSTTDGHLVATLPFSVGTWSLASDGSYFCAGGSAGLTAWNSSGTSIVSKGGDYSKGSAYATPAQILMASPAAGANVVETINVSSGASTIGPAFLGTFRSWFADGGHFLSTVGNNTVLIYSNTSALVEQAPLPAFEVGGTGQFFWVTGATAPGSLDIYTVGGSTAAAATYTGIGNSLIFTTKTALGVLSTPSSVATPNVISVIDLSGVAPAKVDFTVPMADAPIIFTASSAAQWLVGNGWGVVLDGASLATTPRYLGYGQAWSIAGSPSAVAIATASGQILYFDAATLHLQGTIQYPSSQIQLSTDGTVLAALGNTLDLQYNPDWSLNIYSLPSNSVLAHWPYTFSSPTSVVAESFALSGSGTVLAQLLTNARKVTGLTPGSNVIWTDNVGSRGFDPIESPVLLSPDGTLIAAATSTRSPPVTTEALEILKNGVLVATPNGWPVGWVDDNHLIVNTYQPNTTGVNPFTGAHVLDAMGNKLADSGIPELHHFQPLTADTVYSPELNLILSVSSGTAIWSSGDATRGQGEGDRIGTGGVAGNHVVFASGSRVLALSH